MLFTKSIALLSLCASALAGFNNDTETKQTTTLYPATPVSVEAKTTTWTLSDDTTTSYITFTYFQTHTLSDITTSAAANDAADNNKVAVVTDSVTASSSDSESETTTLTSTLYSTLTQGYSNSTIATSSPATVTSSPVPSSASSIDPQSTSDDSNVTIVYVTLAPITSYVTITADPVTQFVTVTAEPTTSANSMLWSNTTITN